MTMNDNMNDNNPVIKTINLSKKFNQLIAVNNINMSITEGSIHGFLGPNGAGKTTTLRMIMGLLKPSAGYITIFGIPLHENEKNLKNKIGYLPGDIVLYNYYTVRQLLNYFESLRGLKNAPLRKELVKRLELDESKTVKSLSTGNRQKVGLVQAFMHDPDLLILDEPTSGLDPLIKIEFFKIIREFKERKKTIIFSSHILSDVEKICDYVSIIKDGSIIATESIKTLNKNLKRKLIIDTNEKFNLGNVNKKSFNLIDKVDNRYIFSFDNNNIKSKISELINIQGIDNYILPEPKIEDYFIKFYEMEDI
ncbi:MAG: putative ABC transporter ATP-binding protein YxlF [Candidatus Heimdallarchaeota archaeon LC_3]|nr:MAG: putative ABC transporter ATP-binding protein YxlF [Candidatus Heimdallarchaeota archaeon LC_3]